MQYVLLNYVVYFYESFLILMCSHSIILKKIVHNFILHGIQFFCAELGQTAFVRNSILVSL